MWKMDTNNIHLNVVMCIKGYLLLCRNCSSRFVQTCCGVSSFRTACLPGAATAFPAGTVR